MPDQEGDWGPLPQGGYNALAEQAVFEVGASLEPTIRDGSVTAIKLATGAAVGNIDDATITGDMLHGDVLKGVPRVYGTGQAGVTLRTDEPRFIVSTGSPDEADLDPGDIRFNAS